jgi:multimeric flavodoxin WrbA
MKVIAINGSPRKNKNTATMLQNTLDGAASQGAETEMFHLYFVFTPTPKLSIQPT